jgi:pyruvate,water dikinase
MTSRSAAASRSISLGCCVALTWIACSDEQRAVPQLAVTLGVASGEAPENFVVVWSQHSGKTKRIACPGGASDSLVCARDGVSISGAKSEDELTIKARGFEFVTERVARAQLARRELSIELMPLAQPEQTTNYRTGFDADDAETEFSDLAVEFHGELGRTQSVKFYIRDLRTGPQVYFQATNRYPRHYDFVRDALGLPVSAAAFESATYHGAERDALAGTLVYAPDLVFASRAAGAELRAPILLQFFPSDDLSPELALVAHRLIEERLRLAALDGSQHRLVYVPAGSEQEQQLSSETSRFMRRDVLFAANVELRASAHEQVLNPGVAYGTLRDVTPEQLERMAVSYRDILVLRRLPNDLPLVGGTLSEELQTPLAHVNVAARARGTPNAALVGATSDPRVAPWLGTLVRYEVTPSGFTLEAADSGEADAFWRSRAPDRFEPQSDLSFDGLPVFEDLTFRDAVRVGYKASNLGELRTLLGDGAPEGFAVPFSGYANYMRSNVMTLSACDDANTACGATNGGGPACMAAYDGCKTSADARDSFAVYAQHILDDPALATDSDAREAALRFLRYAISHGSVASDFAAALDSRVAEIFGDAQVRLRSSSNVEDLRGFSGAGLYTSVSAYAKGARRASAQIREVWASLFAWRAFEERTYWNVVQTAVSMAVAVNGAYDDEAANGVLITRPLDASNTLGRYVNVQVGEIEVTNPENGALPEVFTIVPGPNRAVEVVRERYSSLSLDQPILSDAEIAALDDAAERCVQHFAPLYGAPAASFALELEYKFVGTERALVIKQARPYSTP